MDRDRRKNAQKVVVAMSGGVDSSVAAALLKRENFDVVGVFMKFWSEPRDGPRPINAGRNTDLHRYENRCCTSEAEARARKVAKILKIPFYVFNFEKEFKKRIVDSFLNEYKKGITPNPCVVCNKEIKFGLLLEKALKLDADYIATGHYARIRKFVNSQQIRYSLISARDKNKDQSYFLWQLNQKKLERILFPIGNYTREEVEKLAKKFKLPVLGIRKSVEICFIKTTINDFLKKHLKEKPGPVVEQVHYGVKKIVGQHQGLWFYTIGQRKGIKLPGGPYYVLDKDTKKNLLIVAKNEKDLYKKELTVQNISWISPKQSLRDATGQAGKEPRLRQGFGGQAKLPLKVKAKIRYRHEPSSATIHYLKYNTYHLIFDRPQRAITPGQSLVFYRGQELLGGGIIC